MSIGIDVVGASSAGIVSTIFQAGGGVVDYVKREQQEQAAARSADGALAAAIAADAAATNAVARAIASAQIAKIDPSKAATAKADKTTADAAVVAQDKAGAAVPEEKRADRVRAAQEVVDDAAARVKAASGSAKAIAQARLGAATQTLSRARGGSSVEKDVQQYQPPDDGGGDGGAPPADDVDPNLDPEAASDAEAAQIDADADVLGRVLGQPQILGDDAVIGGDGEPINLDNWGNALD